MYYLITTYSDDQPVPVVLDSADNPEDLMFVVGVPRDLWQTIPHGELNLPEEEVERHVDPQGELYGSREFWITKGSSFKRG